MLGNEARQLARQTESEQTAAAGQRLGGFIVGGAYLGPDNPLRSEPASQRRAPPLPPSSTHIGCLVIYYSSFFR